MADQTKPNGAAAPAGEVTEEALLKSLKELEGKKDEPALPAPPVVKTVELRKSADTVDERGSRELRKALDVSEVLADFAGVIGVHVDTVVEELHKSVQGAAERDLVIVAVLQKMAKSITDLTEKVAEFGKQPTSGKAITVPQTEVLTKGAESGKLDEEDPAKVRSEKKQQVLQGLELLAKSAKGGSGEQQRFINAAVKFETTGVISDMDLAMAVRATKPAA